MLQKIKDWLNKSATVGLKFPFAHDPVLGKPSVTLLFVYITFMLAVASVITLNFTDSVLIASITSIGFWFLAFITYRLRRLDNVKIDLDDKSIELQSSDEGSQGDKKDGQ